jgi:hypothetical protein
VFCTGISTADPAVDADAPPAIAKDSPATPNAGAALFRLFRFELVFAHAIGVLHTFAVGRFHEHATFHYIDHLKKN